MERSDKFIEQLYTEKEMHKEHRHKHLLHKLFFISAFFGFGSVGIKLDYLKPLLFLVPFVAICHDIYIFSEDFKIKRIGKFLRDLKKGDWSTPSPLNNDDLKNDISHSVSSLEIFWEIWVNDHRERYSVVASFVITILAFFASFLILLIDISKHSIAYVLSLAILTSLSLFPIILIFLYMQWLKKQLLK